MDTENKFASCLGWVVAWLFIAVINTFMDGWALSTIWNWFIPPIFNLVTLTLMQAVGVAMVFSLFTRTNKINLSTKEEKKTSLEKFIEAAVVGIGTPIFSVGIAWIILQFAF